MIKLVSTSLDGAKALMLILEEGNLKRLKQNMPIVVNVNEMFHKLDETMFANLPSFKVVILYSHNIADTEKQIKENFSIGKLIDERGVKK